MIYCGVNKKPQQCNWCGASCAPGKGKLYSVKSGYIVVHHICFNDWRKERRYQKRNDKEM